MRVRIAEVRRSKGVSQQVLADRIGATLSMIGKLERGERQVTMSWLQRIGHALDVPTGELIDASDAVIHIGQLESNGRIAADDFDATGAPDPDLTDEVETLKARGAGRSGLHGVTLQSDATLKIPDGSQLVFPYPGKRPTRAAVGKLAVIWISEHPDPLAQPYAPYVGLMMPGSMPGRFHILPVSGSLIEDAHVHWIALITAINLL